MRSYDRFPAVVLALALLGTACASSPGRVPSEDVETAPEAPASADPTAGAEPGETYKNTVKWATASELDNFGYDVYRAESSEGPFVRVSASVIEGGGTTDEVRRYEFVDDTIDPHKTYYYYVESISMSGERERFTPVGKVGPKIPPKDPDP